MEQAGTGAERGHQPEENRAQHGTGHITAHDADPLVAVQAVQLADNGDGAFARRGDGAADGGAAHFEQKDGGRHAENRRAHVAELLQDQSQRRSAKFAFRINFIKPGSDAGGDLRRQEHDRNRGIGRRLLHRLQRKELPRSHDDADGHGVQHREQTETDRRRDLQLPYAESLGDQRNDDAQRMHFPTLEKILLSSHPVT